MKHVASLLLISICNCVCFVNLVGLDQVRPLHDNAISIVGSMSPSEDPSTKKKEAEGGGMSESVMPDFQASEAIEPVDAIAQHLATGDGKHAQLKTSQSIGRVDKNAVDKEASVSQSGVTPIQQGQIDALVHDQGGDMPHGRSMQTLQVAAQPGAPQDKKPSQASSVPQTTPQPHAVVPAQVVQPRVVATMKLDAPVIKSDVQTQPAEWRKGSRRKLELSGKIQRSGEILNPQSDVQSSQPSTALSREERLDRYRALKAQSLGLEKVPEGSKVVRSPQDPKKGVHKSHQKSRAMKQGRG